MIAARAPPLKFHPPRRWRERARNRKLRPTHSPVPDGTGASVGAGADLRESHNSGDFPTLPDRVEAYEAAGHGDGAGGLVTVAFVAVPAAQSSDHPGVPREHAFGVWIFQLLGLALEP